jgi:hypothetical protein
MMNILKEYHLLDITLKFTTALEPIVDGAESFACLLQGYECVRLCSGLSGNDRCSNGSAGDSKSC